MTVWMILLTLLVASMAGGARAETSSVLDWEACGLYTRCNAAGSCLTAVPTAETMDQLHSIFKPAELKPSDCAIMVQSRNLVSKTVYLIEIMRPDLADRGKGQQVEVLLQANTENPWLLVGCKANGDQVELIAADKYIADYKIELFEKLSFFDENHTLCAFSIERTDKMSADLKDVVGAETMGLRYRTKDASILHQTKPDAQRNLLFPKISCDPYAFQDSSLVDGFKIEPVMNRYRSYINCDKYDDAYKLHYQYKSKEDGVISTLMCIEKKWIIESANGTSSNPIEDIEEYSFWCASKFSQTCTEPPLHCKPPHCPLFTAGTNASDALLTCPDGKWRMEWPTTKKEDPEVEYYANLTVDCKEHDVLQNEAAFFYTIEGAEQQLPETARCFTEYNCEEYAGLFYSDCDAGVKTCRELDLSDGKMQCKSREGDKTPATLTVSETGSNGTSEDDPFTAAFYTCDTGDGQWKDVEGRAIPRFHTVSCEMDVDTDSEEKIPTIYYVFLCLAALLLGGALGGCCGVCLYTRYCGARRHLRKPKDKSWIEMHTSQRVERARGLFELICGSKTVAKDVQILTGLQTIEVLLNTENEDPDVWSECFKFIIFLQGTLRLRDTGILLMLNRYLYLRARKIIEERGWSCPWRITKARPKGLIRAFAIKLLLRSMNGFLKEDGAEDFLFDGMVQLLGKKENATEQYPHCGVMYQALAEIRFEQRSPKGTQPAPYWEDRLAYWNKKACIDELDKLAFKPGYAPEMEPSDVIDFFGTPAEQAATALGGTDCNLYHANQQKTIFTEHAKMVPYYMRGLANTLYTNIIRILIPSRGMSAEMRRALETKPLRATAGTHLEECQRLLLANGSIVDARELEYRLREEKNKAAPKNPSEKLVELTMSQKNFFAAIREQSDAIRLWFSERIPMDDLNYYFENNALVLRKGEFTPAKPPKPILTKHASKGVKYALPATDNDKGPGRKFEMLAGASIDELELVPLVRKKTTLLTPAESEKYRAMVEAIFSEPALVGVLVAFDPKDVLEVMGKMKELMKYEPVLIEDVPAPIVICGDLHGQLHDLDRVFRSRARDGKPGYLCDKYLFMGDYVDRGTQCLEVVMCLFLLKILYPDNFFILRGNHESMRINYTGGFLREMVQRFPQGVGYALYCGINDVFGWLSVSAIVGGEILCTHGGIPTNFCTRRQLRAVHKPILDPAETALIYSLMWCDPSNRLSGTTALHPSCRNGGCLNFGANELAMGLLMLDCTLLVRGHEVMTEGFSVSCGDLCLTVFTAVAATSSMTNKGAAAVLDERLCFAMITMGVIEDREIFIPGVPSAGKKEEEKKEEEEKAAEEENEKTGSEFLGTGKVAEMDNEE